MRDPLVLDRPLTAGDVLRATWRTDVPCPMCRGREQPVAIWSPLAVGDPTLPAVVETTSNAAQVVLATPVRVDWEGARRALDRLAKRPKRAARRPRERSRRK